MLLYGTGGNQSEVMSSVSTSKILMAMKRLRNEMETEETEINKIMKRLF